MTEALWALAGVVVGSIATGVFGLFQQSRQFSHDREMYLLQNRSAENVKEILIEMLNHRKYVERTFNALTKAVGGYDEDEIRQFLHEIGARRSNRGPQEWWYLQSRDDERFPHKEEEQN